MKKLTILMIVLDILAALGFIVTYCVPFVKNTVIMTALNTKTHQWIAYTFYSDKTINKVLSADRYSSPLIIFSFSLLIIISSSLHSLCYY